MYSNPDKQNGIYVVNYNGTTGKMENEDIPDDEIVKEKVKDEKAKRTGDGLLFGVEERPPFYIMIFYAFQVRTFIHMYRILSCTAISTDRDKLNVTAKHVMWPIRSVNVKPTKQI